MDTKETEVVVLAPSYKEFAEKVKEMVNGPKEGFRSLAFLKSVGNLAVYVDGSGNKTYYVWEQE